MLTGRQLWRRARFAFGSTALIFASVWVILRIESIPLPLRFALLTVVGGALTALVGWWSSRTGDERDREDFAREWAWVRRLWRRARLRRP